MQTRTGVVPTRGLPPRPVVTDWRWRWPDGSVVSVKSRWHDVALRLWTDIRVRYPATFDAVEIAPRTAADDGPDAIEAVVLRIAVYPDVWTTLYGSTSEFALPTYVERLGPMILGAHENLRWKGWRRLEPLPVACYRQLWWHPEAKAEMMKRAGSIVLGPGMYADR